MFLLVETQSNTGKSPEVTGSQTQLIKISKKIMASTIPLHVEASMIETQHLFSLLALCQCDEEGLTSLTLFSIHKVSISASTRY
jgi:hypothetical protein